MFIVGFLFSCITCCVVFQVMDLLPIRDEAIHDRLITTLLDSAWPNFPGIQSFVLKVSCLC